MSFMMDLLFHIFTNIASLSLTVIPTRIISLNKNFNVLFLHNYLIVLSCRLVVDSLDGSHILILSQNF